MHGPRSFESCRDRHVASIEDVCVRQVVQALLPNQDLDPFLAKYEDAAREKRSFPT